MLKGQRSEKRFRELNLEVSNEEGEEKRKFLMDQHMFIFDGDRQLCGNNVDGRTDRQGLW